MVFRGTEVVRSELGWGTHFDLFTPPSQVVRLDSGWEKGIDTRSRYTGKVVFPGRRREGTGLATQERWCFQVEEGKIWAWLHRKGGVSIPYRREYRDRYTRARLSGEVRKL